MVLWQAANLGTRSEANYAQTSQSLRSDRVGFIPRCCRGKSYPLSSARGQSDHADCGKRPLKQLPAFITAGDETREVTAVSGITRADHSSGPLYYADAAWRIKSHQTSSLFHSVVVFQRYRERGPWIVSSFTDLTDEHKLKITVDTEGRCPPLTD
jgi:hypothetical protein